MLQATNIDEFGNTVVTHVYAALDTLGMPRSAFAMISEPAGSPHPHVVIRISGRLHEFKVPGEFEVVRTDTEVRAYVERQIRLPFRMHG